MLFFYLILSYKFGSQKIADIINNDNSLTWSAKEFNFLSSLYKIKPNSLSLLNNFPKKELNKLIPQSKKTHDYKSYNFFDEYPKCWTPIFFQDKSTMCYSIAVASVLSHRLCMKNNENINLNPQPIFGCDVFSNGMKGGGKEQFAWRFTQTKGIPTTDCLPFSITAECLENKRNISLSQTNKFNNNTFKNIKQECKLYKSEFKSEKSFVGEDEIIEEILKNGPVTATIDLMSDFGNYAKGIYKTSSFFNNNMNELHNIEIYGWGEEKGTPYWLIRNSFGDKWGINGTAKFLRGSNHCGIESYATSAIPK